MQTFLKSPIDTNHCLWEEEGEIIRITETMIINEGRSSLFGLCGITQIGLEKQGSQRSTCPKKSNINCDCADSEVILETV